MSLQSCTTWFFLEKNKQFDHVCDCRLKTGILKDVALSRWCVGGHATSVLTEKSAKCVEYFEGRTECAIPRWHIEMSFFMNRWVSYFNYNNRTTIACVFCFLGGLLALLGFLKDSCWRYCGRTMSSATSSSCYVVILSLQTKSSMYSSRVMQYALLLLLLIPMGSLQELLVANARGRGFDGPFPDVSWKIPSNCICTR